MYTLPGLPGSGKNIWKMNEIFSRSGKSQGILWMPKEIQKRLGKSGKINGFGRQSSENLFILFKREKDVHSHEIV